MSSFYETLAESRDAAAGLFDTAPDMSMYANEAPRGFRTLEPAMTADGATLDVQEDYGEAAPVTVTFKLRRADDGWHLVSLGVTAAGDVSTAKLDEASARKVVDDFYAAVTRDQVADAKKLITAKGLADIGGEQLLKQKGVISSWQIVNAGGSSKEYEVRTIIQTLSGPEKWVFTLGVDGGRVKIIGWKYDEDI